MFQDLDSTLAELLRSTLPASLVGQVSISFATPDGQFPPASVSLPTINLFLYALKENQDLRSNEPFFDRRSDGAVSRVPPPLRVDCHYLVTAWARAGDSVNQDEHRMLGEVLTALARHREIPTAVLRGSMREQPFALSAAILRATPEQRGDFWQALGGKPRAAFDYRVTVAVVTGVTADAGPLVKTVHAPISISPSPKDR